MAGFGCVFGGLGDVKCCIRQQTKYKTRIPISDEKKELVVLYPDDTRFIYFGDICKYYNNVHASTKSRNHFDELLKGEIVHLLNLAETEFDEIQERPLPTPDYPEVIANIWEPSFNLELRTRNMSSKHTRPSRSDGRSVPPRGESAIAVQSIDEKK